MRVHKLKRKTSSYDQIEEALRLKKNNTSILFIHSSLKSPERPRIRKALNLECVAKIPIEYKEDEKLLLTEGMCFGEWGVLYNKERTASAYVLEDADLFMMEKDSFENTLGVVWN